jgi:hypothetical protein
VFEITDSNHWQTALDDLAQDMYIRGIKTYEFREDRISFSCPICKAPASARLRAWNDVVMSCSKGCSHRELVTALELDDPLESRANDYSGLPLHIQKIDISS